MIKAVSIYTDEYMSAMMRHIRSDAKRKRRLRLLVIMTITGLAILVSFFLPYYLRHENFFTPLTVAISAEYLVHIWFEWDGFLLKKDKANGIRKRTFVFSEDNFALYTEEGGFYAERMSTYDNLRSAAETEDWFFIAFRNKQLCIIRKDDLVEGTVPDLREFLTNKMGEKFCTDDLRKGA